MCITWEIQRSDGQASFVGCVIIERIIVCDSGRADHRKMRAERGHMPEGKRIAARHDHHGFIERIFQIQISAEVVIAGFKTDSGAHA